MRFYLGTHETSWLRMVDVPLFISHRRLALRRRFPVAIGPWALDSGAFSEIAEFGEWRTSEADYIAAVCRYADEIGRLEWVAPMDWMCEPSMLAKTGLSVAEHQRRTTDNFLRLREQLGALVIPVLQGWYVDDYLRHVEEYVAAGVDLDGELTVGVGSVCKRFDSTPILRPLGDLGLNLHAFGVKGDNLAACTSFLTSADSMSWSYAARRNGPLAICTHKTCANCLSYALIWRRDLLNQVAASKPPRPRNLTIWENPCAA